MKWSREENERLLKLDGKGLKLAVIVERTPGRTYNQIAGQLHRLRHGKMVRTMEDFMERTKRIADLYVLGVRVHELARVADTTPPNVIRILRMHGLDAETRNEEQT